MQNIKIRNLIIESVKELECISPTPRLDVEILLCHVLKIDKIKLMTSYESYIEEKDLKEFKNYMEKRKKSMPIAYIINKKEFMGYDFYVDENVLIPRPDTELIVEKLYNKIKVVKKDISNGITNRHNNLKILDMCTGSGAIIVSVKKLIQENEVDINAEFYGVDLSKEALNICKKNIKELCVEPIELINSDLFASSKFEELIDSLDIIVSNPPYIEDDIINTLKSDVKDYEPMMALVGGQDGMRFYNAIIEDSLKYLKNNGYLIFESGHNQARKIEKKMLECGYTDINIYKDLQGFERCILGKLVKI
ncbi:peptide chain release factor N(5)-glutamine methyltransferase [Peptostreptococcus equinus]|uniref:Release factor glutamine methyltransferase n=1 Tax=Peptostreptococcus equinus TaxID=3003601 RepID=A0ABY7JRD7_9FIRM|nr:peptide chain release factor N(5)-glutamine methyltransferase [Peptostreptococcus sp. CBA3647]WAW15061.1 peptide chain release factor N(5)-glutamine methyltransferase [Peptostreptococcus sp. CBA3647]